MNLNDVLQDYFAGDLAIFADVVGATETRVVSLILELKSALAAKDAGRIELAAHALKGSMMHFHRTEPVQILEQMEVQARQGRAEFPASDADAVVRWIWQIIKEARQFIACGGRSL